MFGKIHELGRFFGGQYIYLIADMASLKTPRMDDECMFPEYCAVKIPKSPSCVWGASTKGVLFCLNAMRSGRNVDYAVDINPTKWGKFMPVSGVPVISPSQMEEILPKETTIYVANPNYYDEIVRMSGGKFAYEVIH